MLDRTLRALAEPTRREILRALRARSLTAGEIAERFPMTAATVSHHLSVLREAELVDTERAGRSIVYSLNATLFQEAIAEIAEFFDMGESR